MIDWNIVWRDFVGISWSGALGVIASSVVLYLFFTLLIHLSGPRLMANPTVGSFVVLAVIGGVTARATLGERSEERRVGKECRYRWREYMYKKCHELL